MKLPRPKLSIGMAVYDDFDGFWFTLQALRLYHDLSQCELIVVDNHPGSRDSQEMAAKIQMLSASGARIKYVPMSTPVGTAAPRNRIFAEAAGENVLVIDSHVLLPAGVIARLIAYYDAHPDCQDLLTGPILLDSLNPGAFHTHFDDVWRGEMWGTWGNAWQVPCAGGETFSTLDDAGRARFVSLEMNASSLTYSGICGAPLPEIPYAGHQQALRQLGFRPLGESDEDEFEIPGQGLGLFSCRRAAWPGFNQHFRQFGGEELYIHNKFRQRGGRALCLGFLKWAHKFARPGGVKFPISLYTKARNYVLGKIELGDSLDPVYDHFVTNGRLKQAAWDYLIADPIGRESEPGTTAINPAQSAELPGDTQGLYEMVRAVPRDLEKHFPRLKALAEQCPRVTEFSKRQESLVALAAGNPRQLTSYNTESDKPFASRVAALVPAATIQNRRSADLPSIEETDLLFIDSQHSFATASAELAKFGPSVRRYIVMHDTHQHATRGEDGSQPGLVEAIRQFILAYPSWFIASHTHEQYGLTVLGCQEEDRPPSPIILWAPGFGPGTEMKAMLAALGINPSPSCDCNGRALQMDRWGVAGCQKNRDTIVGWIREGQQRWKWADAIDAAAHAEEKKPGLFAIAWKAITSGLVFQLNPLDPVASLVDQAIRRAEEKETSAKEASAKERLQEGQQAAA